VVRCKFAVTPAGELSAGEEAKLAVALGENKGS